ncbi:hypothetical protein RS1P1_28440 [Pseudomonas moraviensis]|nr:hypothetical protein RS1P1_28440 [Pseudomonas moraviensis]
MIVIWSFGGTMRFTLGLMWFDLGGLWADQAVGGLGAYPLLRVLLLAVPPLRRVTFADAQK